MPYRKLRPHPLEKSDRNKEIVQYQKDHPEATLRKIASEFNISPSRVCYILKRDIEQNRKKQRRTV